MRTPLVVVTGVEPQAVDGTLIGLTWDLPRAVSVRHRIDPDSQVLTRFVSDATGVLEHEEIELEHACVTCAIREDILPTLERLSRDERWSTIVASLPIGTEADHLGNVLVRDTRLARHLRLTSVVAALGAARLVDDLLGDDLLRERGLNTNPGDGRGVGEVGCAQVEYADVVVVDEHPGDEAVDLVAALAQPQAQLVLGADRLEAATLTEGRHSHRRTTAWCAPVLGVGELPSLGPSQAWRLDLSSPRPFHPERLLDHVDRLGSGPRRSRGCFWLPTRPGDALQWCGAGGQLSIGTWRDWGRQQPLTRLVLTGLGQTPRDLVATFEDLLLTPAEARVDLARWRVLEDGLEPWLGDIQDVA